MAATPTHSCCMGRAGCLGFCQFSWNNEKKKSRRGLRHCFHLDVLVQPACVLSPAVTHSLLKRFTYEPFMLPQAMKYLRSPQSLNFLLSDLEFSDSSS